jgi:phosphoribosylformimino-5-aminoimidazole carboxamide ribotide isomerase
VRRAIVAVLRGTYSYRGSADGIVIAIPALDLRGGACVQVAASSPTTELLRIPDPVGVAVAWRQYGFHHLHVIDLDAFAGRGNNAATIDSILGSTDAEVQIGGGIRDVSSIDHLLNEGARRVVVGARALEDADWIAEASTTFPGQIVVALDVRDRKVLTRGWTRSNSRLALDVAEELRDLPLAALLVTIVNRDPGLHGSDLALLEDIVETTELPIFAAGTVGNVNDLRSLAERGIAAAILGIELYAGLLNPRAVADEFVE